MRGSFIARAAFCFEDGAISMAVGVTTNSHDKKTVARAVSLRDAALEIRTLMQEWQPGVCVSSVQRGPFRIRYRDPATDAVAKRPNRRPARKEPRRSFGLEIVGPEPLLRTEWDKDAVVLTLFERGHWESEFLRLASPTRRVKP